ncbi:MULTISPECIES: hypothetical protein [Pseudofrankia]|uniref:hypothetical protein n=1 Tax=Pseudofrankia TaxID=2994363 RepID=UPI0002E228CE|nr:MULTISPECIES: hypothetical protein [Pseudofrankia]OHV37665.1 hypothetical protein BCD49_03350 [Pseudofrankia sp. EUN1h]
MPAPGPDGWGQNAPGAPGAGWSAPGSELVGGDGADGARRGAFRRPAGRPASAATGVVPLRPLNVSEILDGAFVTMRTNPGATLGLTLVTGAVFETIGAIMELLAQDTSFAFYALLQVVLRGLNVMLVILLAGVLAVVVAEASLGSGPAGGSRINLGAAVRRVAPRLPGLAGLALLVTVLMILGLATVGVVSVWLGVLFCFATPVYALEGGTVTGALRRSRYLIRGAWWRTFGILLLAGVIAGTLVLVVSVPIALFTAPASSSLGESSGHPSVAGLVIQALGSLLVVTIVTPVLAGVIAVLYIDRRIRREALDVALARAAATGATDVVAAAAAPPAAGFPTAGFPTASVPVPGAPFPGVPVPGLPPAGAWPPAQAPVPGQSGWPHHGGWS